MKRQPSPSSVGRLRRRIAFLIAAASCAPAFAPRSAEAASATIRAGAEKQTARTEQPIDLNTASREALMRVPGIGAKRADRIIELRSRRPFRRVRELTRVKGIGPKLYERMQHHFKIEPLAQQSQ